MKKIFFLAFILYIIISFTLCSETNASNDFEQLKQKRLAFAEMILAGEADVGERGGYIIPDEYKNIAKQVYTYVSDDEITFYFVLGEGILGESSGVTYHSGIANKNIQNNGLTDLCEVDKIEDNWYKALTN